MATMKPCYLLFLWLIVKIHFFYQRIDATWVKIKQIDRASITWVQLLKSIFDAPICLEPYYLWKHNLFTFLTTFFALPLPLSL